MCLSSMMSLVVEEMGEDVAKRLADGAAVQSSVVPLCRAFRQPRGVRAADKGRFRGTARRRRTQDFVSESCRVSTSGKLCTKCSARRSAI
jgi:hypothetical protein